MFIFEEMQIILKKYFIVAICFFSFSLQISAQDVHYTQYGFLPLLQNAANSGFFEENFRFSTIYRNQWASVPVNYNSIGFSFDANFLRNYKTGSKAGAGLNFYFDQAGDSKFQTLHLMVPVAYHLHIPISDHKLKMSLGFEAGIQYKSLSTADLYYDSQFNGEVYNPDAPTNEDFTNLNVLNPDFGAGIHFEFETSNKLKIGLGFAVKHLNQAEETYQNANIKPTLRKRFVAPTYVKVPISLKWDAEISYLFNLQNQSQGHLTTILVGYYLQNIGEFKKKINFGVAYRFADAPAVIFQYQAPQFKLGMSYDINTSKFARATNTYGGVEIAATYLIKNIAKVNSKVKRKCYTF